MATPIAFEMSGLSGALKMSLENWGKTNAKYAPLFKTMSPEVLNIGYAALEEMPSIKPASFEEWWARQHNRFIRNKNVKQRELLLLHEVMYHFLTAFSRGQLANDRIESPTTIKNKAKTKSRQ